MNEITLYDGLIKGVSDNFLKQLIENKVPSGILVNVSTCTKNFGGVGSFPAKRIVLEGTFFSRLTSIIVDLFQSIRRLFQPLPPRKPIDEPAVGAYLLGNVGNYPLWDEVQQKAIEEIQSACDRRMKLIVFISADGKSLACESRQEVDICTIS